MADLFDTLVEDPKKKKDLFDEVAPAPAGDIFDQVGTPPAVDSPTEDNLPRGTNGQKIYPETSVTAEILKGLPGMVGKMMLPTAENAKDFGAAAAYEGAGAVKGATLGYVDPTKALDKTPLADADISKPAAEGTGQFVGAMAPISKISQAVHAGLAATGILESVHPILQGLVQSGIVGSIYGAARDPGQPAAQEGQLAARAHNALDDAASFIVLTGAGQLVDQAAQALSLGKNNAYDSLRQDIIDKFTSKGATPEEAAQMADAGLQTAVKNGGGWAEVKASDLRAARRAVRAGQKIIIGEAGEQTPGMDGGLSQPQPTPPALNGPAGVVPVASEAGGLKPEAPPESSPPSTVVDEHSVSVPGIQYLKTKFPALAQEIVGKPVPLPPEQLQDVLTKAAAAGEEVLLKGGNLADANAAAVQHFQAVATPLIQANAAKPQPVAETPSSAKPDVFDEAEAALAQTQPVHSAPGLADVTRSLGIQPHEMPLDQYGQAFGESRPQSEVTAEHRGLVNQALQSGKSVPAEVLADHPNVQSDANKELARQAAQEVLAKNKIDDRTAINLVNHIVADNAAFKAGRGRDFNPETDIIRGETKTPLDRGSADRLQSVINLADGSGPRTGRHEAFHAVSNMLLDDGERAIIENQFKNMEDAADAFADHRSGKKTVTRGPLQAIFDKIKKFLERLKNYFKHKKFGTAEDVFDAIDRGDLAERPHQANAGKTEYQSAYHGTPHKFDKFDISKIGSGEGNQAFGWGLYFAGKKEVAEFYRDKLSQAHYSQTYDGVPVNELSPEMKNAVLRMSTGSKKETYIRELRASLTKQEATKPSEWGVPENRNRVIVDLRNEIKTVEGIDESRIGKRKVGALYKVDIPEDYEFLNHDTVLADQSKGIRKITDKISKELNLRADPYETTGEQFYDEIVTEFAQGRIPPITRTPSGGYSAEENASRYLAEKGIPGLKYLDQGSRGANAGTSNYVLFDDKAAKIISQYSAEEKKSGEAIKNEEEAGQVGGRAQDASSPTESNQSSTEANLQPLQDNGLARGESQNTVFQPTSVSSNASIANHPDFVKMTKDAEAVVRKYAMERGVEPNTEFATSLWKEMHDKMGEIMRAGPAQGIAKINEIKAQYPDIEREFTALRDKLWSDRTQGFFNVSVAGKYGHFRPKVALDAETAQAPGIQYSAEDVRRDIDRTLIPSRRNDPKTFTDRMALRRSLQRQVTAAAAGASAQADRIMGVQTVVSDAIDKLIPEADRGKYLDELVNIQTLDDADKFISKIERDSTRLAAAADKSMKKEEIEKRKSAMAADKTERSNLRRLLMREAAVARQAAVATNRDITEIKRSIVNNIEAQLPVEERGRFLKMIASASNWKHVIKAVGRIDQAVDQYARKSVINSLKREVQRVQASQAIAVDYRWRVNDLLQSVLFKKPMALTLSKLNNLQHYVDEQRSLGHDTTVPQYVTDRLKVLTSVPLDKIHTTILEDVLGQVRQLAELGKTKLRAMKDLDALHKQADIKDLQASTLALDKAQITRPLPGNKQTISESTKNIFRKAVNSAQHVNSALMPSDVMFDLLDGMQSYSGPNFRIFKSRFDQQFGLWLDEYGQLESKTLALANELKLSRESMDRIGLFATAAQEDGIQKLYNNFGVNPNEKTRTPADNAHKQKIDAFIKSIRLTPPEKKLYDFMRSQLDGSRPRAAEVMRLVYNAEMGQEKNYFPFMSDYSLMEQDAVQDRVQRQMIGKKKNVEMGFTQSRVGAGDQKVNLNAMDVFLKHMSDVYYMIHTGQTVKYLGELANSPEYAKVAGQAGVAFVRDWIDTLARKGGAAGANQLRWLDTIRVNQGLAMIPFRIATALVHVTPLATGAGMIGNYAFRGLFHFASPAYRQFLNNNFPEIARMEGNDPTYMDYSYKGGPLKKAQQLGYLPLKKIVKMATSSIAIGAYQQWLDQHDIPLDFNKPNKDAIAWAQLMARRANASSYFKDVPQTLSRGGLTGSKSVDRMIFQYGNYRLGQFSVFYHDGLRNAAAGNYTKSARVVLSLIGVLMATAGIRRTVKELLRHFTGEKPPKHPHSFWEDVGNEAVGLVPFVSPLQNLVMHGRFGVPVLDTMLNAGQAAHTMMTAKTSTAKGRHSFEQAELKALGVLLGMFGIPGTSQMLDLIAGSKRK